MATKIRAAELLAGDYSGRAVKVVYLKDACHTVYLLRGVERAFGKVRATFASLGYMDWTTAAASPDWEEYLRMDMEIYLLDTVPAAATP